MLDGLRDRLRSIIHPPPPPPPPPPKPASSSGTVTQSHPAPAKPPHEPGHSHPEGPRPAAAQAGGSPVVSGTASDAAGGAREAVAGTRDGVSVRNGIDKLNGAGDSTTLRVTPEAKLLGNFRGFKVGAKGQLGSTIQVTRDSDQPASSYTVRYDKHTLAAAVGEAGTTTLKGGQAAGGGRRPADATLKAELGAQGFDVVEMRFANKDDATRAAETLHRLQRADMLDDAMDMTASAATPLPLRAAMPDPSLSGGGSSPTANPMNGDGAPGRISRHLTGVSDTDMDFLKAHVTAYETTIGSRGRLAAELKGDLKILDGAVEGRIDGSQRITRRVEMPTADKDGAVTYSVTGDLRLSAKERANRKVQNFGGVLTLKEDNRLEMANARTTASLRYTLPAGTDPTTSGGGRPVPEADALSGRTGMQLDAVTLENRLEWRDQSLADLSRGDSNRITERLELNDPARLREAAGQLFEGRFEDAARSSGGRLSLRADTIERSGTDTQPGVKLDLGIADLEATAILTTGVEDIVGTRAATLQPGADATPGTPGGVAWKTPPAPADDGKTYSVQPHHGAIMRETPQGAEVGTIQSGSFLRDMGGRKTTADGSEWMQLSGTDERDRAVNGWVRADLVQRHDSATGAMDGTGRINPTAEYNRMDRITVEKDDNLWNLAREHGWDFDATLAANGKHLDNPSLIFKGDTVYVPNSARGPERQRVDLPPIPGTPGTPSLETQSQGRNGIDGSSLTPTESALPWAVSAPSAPRAPAPAGPVGPAGPVAGAPADVAGRPALADVLTRYQADADATTADWKPRLLDGAGGGIAGFGAGVLDRLAGTDTRDMLRQLDRKGLPASEAAALDRLGNSDQLDWAQLTKKTGTDAIDAFARPAGFQGDDSAWSNDGHVDAYRHALWNARMTHHFGEDWTREYATAHERQKGNPGAREAMDLFNNEVGRRIATQNPGASDADLQRLVREAVDRGDTVVVDRSHRLAWSDRVALGQHGRVPPGTPELPGNANHNAAPVEDRTGS